MKNIHLLNNTIEKLITLLLDKGHTQRKVLMNVISAKEFLKAVISKVKRELFIIILYQLIVFVL